MEVPGGKRQERLERAPALPCCARVSPKGLLPVVSSLASCATERTRGRWTQHPRRRSAEQSLRRFLVKKDPAGELHECDDDPTL